MKFVLIMLLTSWGKPVTIVAEFDDIHACTTATAALIETYKALSVTRVLAASCIPKASKSADAKTQSGRQS